MGVVQLTSANGWEVAGADEAYINDATPYRTLATAMTRGVDAYRYKDYGASYFSGDFTHYIDFRLESFSDYSYAAPWMLANVVDDTYGVETKTNSIVTSHVTSADDSGGGVYGAVWIGVKFTPSVNHTVTYIKFKGYKDAAISATETLTAAIWGMTSGHPDPNKIYSTGTLDANTMTTNVAGEWYAVAQTAYALVASTQYCLVLKLPGSTGGEHIHWLADNEAGTYEYSTNSGVSWDSYTDANFSYEEGYYSEPYLSVAAWGTALTLREFWHGIAYDDSYTMTKGQLVYLKIVRDEDTGTYGTLYCYIYGEPSHTTLLDTLTLTLHEKVNFRYLYMMNSYASGSTNPVTCWSGNLYMDETPPAMLDEVLSNFVIKADDTETFESLTDGDSISDADADLTWTVSGSVVADNGLPTPPEGSMMAKITCAGGLSYAYFTHSGAATKNGELCAWVYVDSVGDTSDAELVWMYDPAGHGHAVGAVVQATDSTHRYWRIWAHDGIMAKSTQTTYTAKLDTWYQILLFQDAYLQASLWVREAGTSTWTEVESYVGVDSTFTQVYIGSITGTPTSTVYVDLVKWQSGDMRLTQIARGGTGDNTILLGGYICKRDAADANTYALAKFSTTTPTADPSCWTYRYTPVGDLNTGQIVWDSVHSCWWEFLTIGTYGTDASCEVYQIDADFTRTKRDTYTHIDDALFWYIIPSRIIESGKILCSLMYGPVDYESGNTDFITFDTNTAYGATSPAGAFSTHVHISTGVDDLADYVPAEATLWRNGTNLISLQRWAEQYDTPAHSLAAAKIWEKYYISANDGASWGSISNPGGDTGQQIQSYSGWLTAITLGGYTWYQGYNARVTGVSTYKDYKSFVALVDPVDGAIITERDWGWGPLGSVYDKGFCFGAGNGAIDVKDNQSGTSKLDVVFQRGIGWYLQVDSGITIANFNILFFGANF